MSFNNANLPIQVFVDGYGNLGRNYEAIPFIINTSAANQNVTFEDNTFVFAAGKLRTVRLNYVPINCDVEGSCSTSLCDDGTSIPPKQIDFDVTRCTALKKIQIPFDEIRKIDYNTWDFSGYAKQLIAAMLPNGRKLLASDWLTYFSTLAGLQLTGNATRRINPVNTSNGVINPTGVLSIKKDFMDGGFDRPYILGGDDIYYLTEMTRMGGLNALGQQIGMGDTANMYYDDSLLTQILNDEVNGGHIFALDPNVFKYISYSENAGIFRTDLASIEDMDMLFRGSIGEGFMLGTLTDPITGIIWDLYINFEKCGGADGKPIWTAQIKHRWDFFVMPDVACNIQGVNGIMHYRTCPQVLEACPEGVSPSPNVAQSVFSWTPGSIYGSGLYIATLALGGHNGSPNIEVNNITELTAVLNDAPVGLFFSTDGTSISYTGTDGITGSINGNTAITFA